MSSWCISTLHKLYSTLVVACRKWCHWRLTLPDVMSSTFQSPPMCWTEEGCYHSLTMSHVKNYSLLYVLNLPTFGFIGCPQVLALWEKKNNISLSTISTPCTVSYTSITSPLPHHFSNLKNPGFLLRELLHLFGHYTYPFKLRMSFLRWDDQNWTQCSMCVCTIDLYSGLLILTVLFSASFLTIPSMILFFLFFFCNCHTMGLG